VFGLENQATGTYAFCNNGLGNRGISRQDKQCTHMLLVNSKPNGDAQRARFVLRNATTNDTPTALFLDGSTTRLTIPVNKAMGFTIQVVGSYQERCTAAATPTS
jgi:hypothetical protein